jgi:hypothetical protein
MTRVPEVSRVFPANHPGWNWPLGLAVLFTIAVYGGGYLLVFG